MTAGYIVLGIIVVGFFASLWWAHRAEHRNR